MRSRSLVVYVTLLMPWLAVGAAQAAPEVGAPAPAFTFQSQEGAVRLSDFIGPELGEAERREGVVVAWFPKAFTPG